MKPKMMAWEILERGWCQGTAARDCHGLAVRLGDESATRFCTVGALAFVYGNALHDYQGVYDELRIVLGGSSWIQHGVPVWNDRPERTHAEVVQAVKLAEWRYWSQKQAEQKEANHESMGTTAKRLVSGGVC